MPVTQYIGSRYVPIFADPVEWSSAKEYEPLTIVLHDGNSFTSKQFVPVGIDIANETYWAETGNYNAQVESYRQEVHDYQQVVSDVSTEITNLSNLLPAEDFSESYTVADSIESQINNVKVHRSLIDNEYIGRISFIDEPNKVTGGCTLLDENTLLFVGCNNTTTNDCTLYVIDLITKTVVNTYDRVWFHANGVSYDKFRNKVYVSPNYNYDESYRLNTILECNSRTFSVENTYEFDFNPHGIVSDGSGKLYILGTPEVSIYDFNPTTGTATLVKTNTISDILEQVFTQSGDLFGWQDASYYDNAIYLLRSGSAANCIVKIPLDSDNFEFFFLNRNVSYFVDPEAEGITMDENGNAIICGRSVSFAGSYSDFGTIYRVPINKPISFGEITENKKSRTGIARVNGSVPQNQTISPTGSQASPYPSFIEGYMALKNLFAYNDLSIVGNTTLKNMGGKVYENINLTIGAGVVLDLVESVYFANVRFLGNSGTHAIIRRPQNSTSPLLYLLLTNTIRYVDFDFQDGASTVAMVQTRLGVCIVMNVSDVNNVSNAAIARGEGGSILLADSSTNGRFVNYSGTLYPSA